MSRRNQSRRKRALVRALVAACCIVLAGPVIAGDKDAMSLATRAGAANLAPGAGDQIMPAGEKGLLVYDPTLGKLVDVREMSKDRTMELAPGRLEGQVTDMDGTPHKGLRVALLDSTGMSRLGTLHTGLNGDFSFADVKAGTYLVQVGNPGVVTPVKVSPEAEAGVLDMRIPSALTVPTIRVPSWMPEWFHRHPVAFTGTVVGGGALVVGGGWLLLDDDDDHDDDKRISPISP